MKSIKIGRGPSFMGGIASLAVGVFGIFWMIGAASMGGGFFALFGLIFVFIAIGQAIYSFKNATSKNRFSAFDITDDKEETDPLNAMFGQNSSENQNDDDSIENSSINENAKSADSLFCPYCGAKLENDFEFCNKCGRKLPE
ncbi:MAG: zinc ribbon domain-containing protein [Saccharofermentanales bacterium]